MVIVDDHHKVLQAWAHFRRKLSHAPRLLTLDHHTDTSSPFRHRLNRDHPSADRDELRRQWTLAIDYQNEQSIGAAIDKLSHDEHIQTALAADIISAAFVIAHNARDTDLNVFREHRIICRSVNRDGLSRPVDRQECDRVLESDFLQPLLESFDSLLAEAGEKSLTSKPYILDIDLDYLNTKGAIHPKDPQVLHRLVREAGLITVATEAHHVRSLALDSDLTSDFLLEALLRLTPEAQ